MLHTNNHVLAVFHVPCGMSPGCAPVRPCSARAPTEPTLRPAADSWSVPHTYETLMWMLACKCDRGNVFVNTCTQTHPGTHTSVLSLSHTHTFTFPRWIEGTPACTRAHTHIHTYSLSLTHTRMHARMIVWPPTPTPTHSHTCTHTHTHTHTCHQTQKLPDLALSIADE